MRISVVKLRKSKARADRSGNRKNLPAVAPRPSKPELNRDELIEAERERTAEAVERLRYSKREAVDRLAQRGRAYGVAWAKERAEYYELRNIAKVKLKHVRESGMSMPASDIALIVAGTALKRGCPELRDPYKAYELSKRLIGEFYGVDANVFMDVVSLEFVVGFIEGAQDVWRKVRKAVR